jgi:quercetin dioxygenase-like cupin family protein
MTALLGGSLLYIRSAEAQLPPGLEFIPLAYGPNFKDRIRINEKGPSDVVIAKLVSQPGADTGWHTHPGPAIVVITKGTATEYHANGCVTVYQAGSVFLEEPGEVHRLVNGPAPGEAYITFILPAGTVAPLQPAAEPRPRACKPRGNGGDDDHRH